MNIDLEQLEQEVARAIHEDVRSGDVTAELLPKGVLGQAEIISREPMVVCGQAWVNQVFRHIDKEIQVHWQVQEGEWLHSPHTLCQIKGRVRNILTAERVALNFLQTLSATATQTHKYVRQLNGTTARLLDTRKTIPGLRLAQKYAVHCGGGVNHRLGLYDAYLIKENHIKACGSVAKAIERARHAHNDLLVEIEVENLSELKEALAANPDRILLDNFSLDLLSEAVRINHPKQCPLEASGGVTLDNIHAIAATGVDFISVGAITKSIQAIDLSLLVREII